VRLFLASIVTLTACGFDIDLGTRIASDSGNPIEDARADSSIDAPPIDSPPIDAPPIDMAPPKACLSDASFTTRPSTGHRYSVSTTMLSWNLALAACMTTGAHLVAIEDATENEYVDDLSGSIFWIGLSDQVVENSFVWATGLPLTAASYTSWRDGQPNNESGGQDCVEMDPNDAGTWNDYTCASAQRYVCECEP
jgi:hypothetical protein